MTHGSEATPDPSAEDTQSKPEAIAAESLRGIRVAIVEDEGMTAWQLRKILARAGMEVVGAAPDGREGVTLVLKERPDLVLMDINMPVMDGLEAARLILAQFEVCVVMLTAFAVPEYRERAKRLGACGYVIKPITGDSLLPQIERAYHAFSGRKGSAAGEAG